MDTGQTAEEEEKERPPRLPAISSRTVDPYQARGRRALVLQRWAGKPVSK